MCVCIFGAVPIIHRPPPEIGEWEWSEPVCKTDGRKGGGRRGWRRFPVRMESPSEGESVEVDGGVSLAEQFIE